MFCDIITFAGGANDLRARARPCLIIQVIPKLAGNFDCQKLRICLSTKVLIVWVDPPHTHTHKHNDLLQPLVPLPFIDFI